MATALLLCIVVFSMLCSHLNGEFSGHFPVPISTKRMEKTTRLNFYFHDNPTGKNPTTILIAGSQKTFGSTFMMDDSLTEGPDPASKLVGRAQGMYSFVSQHDLGLLMVMNLVFLEGVYNGSPLRILAPNPIMNTVREMPVVGDTAVFRYARGYLCFGKDSFI